MTTTLNLNRQIAAQITEVLLDRDIEPRKVYCNDSEARNTVYTIGQYIMQGFTAEEAPYAREHDIIFNNYHSEGVTGIELARMFAINKVLGL